MFILAYRNDNGALRIGTPSVGIKVHTSAYVAKVTAKHFASVLGRTVTVLDLTDVIASYEPGGDKFDWRVNGWYCQHSYEFCTPCFAGYDHPADEHDLAELEAYEAYHDQATT